MFSYHFLPLQDLGKKLLEGKCSQKELTKFEATVYEIWEHFSKSVSIYLYVIQTMVFYLCELITKQKEKL